MNKILASVSGGAVLAVLLCGCDPELARIPMGPQEQEWYRQLKDNYYSFTPPRTPAPAAYNRNVEQPPAVVPVVAADPDAVVDQAAAGKNVAPVAPVESQEKAKDARDAKDAKEAKAAEDAKAAETDKDAGKAAPAAGTVKGSEADSVIYVVRSEDTLGSIAQKFYGRSSMEDVIFRANSKVIKDRHRLHPGMKLEIPKL